MKNFLGSDFFLAIKILFCIMVIVSFLSVLGFVSFAFGALENQARMLKQFGAQDGAELDRIATIYKARKQKALLDANLSVETLLR